jgi:hypothetical protein
VNLGVGVAVAEKFAFELIPVLANVKFLERETRKGRRTS